MVKTTSNGVHDNIIGNNFYNNMISQFGYHSSFGNEVQNNMMLTTNQCTIGNQFKNNGYTTSLWACDIGNNFHNNFMSGMTKGMSCGNNVSGIYCKSTTGLTIGNDVSNVIIGESILDLSSYNKFVIIESNVQNVTINCTATTSTSSPCQNIKVCQGVHDTTLEIDVSGQDYQIEFKPVGSEIRNV